MLKSAETCASSRGPAAAGGVLGPFPPVPMVGARRTHAAAVLARAFHDYPLFRMLFPEEKHRERALVWFMGFILRYCSRYGEIINTDGDEGLLTFIPGSCPVTRRKLMATGLLLGPLRMGIVPFYRMMKHNNYVAQVSSRLVPPGAWYLWMVGVDPAARNRRLGWKLTHQFLLAADAAGVASYCDTDRREMLGFFLSHGFQVVYEGEAPASGLPFWVVFRPAKP